MLSWLWTSKETKEPTVEIVAEKRLVLDDVKTVEEMKEYVDSILVSRQIHISDLPKGVRLLITLRKLISIARIQSILVCLPSLRLQ